MATNTLSVYVKSPLFEQVKEARAESKIDINKVCSEALERALNPLVGETESAPAPAPVPEVSMDEVARLAALMPVDQDDSYQYEMTFLDTVTMAQAFLDNTVENGGSPVSMCVDPVGRIGFLTAWPKVPASTPV